MLTELANFLFDPILRPLLKLSPVLTILIIALVVSIISIWFQKKFTNQKRMKQVKKDIKKYQNELKKLRTEPEKAMKLQKKMMPLQMEMMKEGFKPALWTMIPFLLLFMWLSANFAYLPLTPGTEFTVSVNVKDLSSITLDTKGLLLLDNKTQQIIDGSAEWTLKGNEEGTYNLKFFDGDILLGNKDILLTNDNEYESPITTGSGKLKKIIIGNKPLKPLDPITLLGWRPGWIFVYIIFTLIFSMIFRKLFDVV